MHRHASTTLHLQYLNATELCWTHLAGQEFAQAAEDAHELALQLRAHGLTPEALRAYGDLRAGRRQRVANTEWASLCLHRPNYECYLIQDPC